MFRWILGLFLCLALQARAGDIFPAVPAGACGDPDVVDQMAAPGNGFPDSPSLKDCVRLCKDNGKTCESISKGVGACYEKFLGLHQRTRKLNCLAVYTEPADVKQCKKDLAQTEKLASDSFKMTVDTEVGRCEAWVDTCQASCEAMNF
jgi:hypothetical protein